MPKLGELKRGKELGYKARGNCIWVACTQCGKERWVQFRKGKPINNLCRDCGHIKVGIAQRHENHPGWEGGRIKGAKGYILICVSSNDFLFSMADKRNYVYEHRLVMARHLGRCLHSWEIVHHKGIEFSGIENRQDNRIENLELVQEMQHNQITRFEAKIDRLLEKQDALMKEIKLLRLENQLLKDGLHTTTPS